jgi:hypothetical protein
MSKIRSLTFSPLLICLKSFLSLGASEISDFTHISKGKKVREMILDISKGDASERNDFRHISKGEQVRYLILDISVKGSK